MLSHYTALYRYLENSPMSDWLRTLPQQVEQALYHSNNGNFPKWNAALEALPEIAPSSVEFDADTVRIGEANDTDHETRSLIETQLREMMPWRKGPFRIHDIYIDTEWHSDWKWNRLVSEIKPLQGRTVLDIGCGNGYHLWRMLGAGARWVLGVDPYLLYVMQFHAIRHFAGEQPVFVAPLGIEDLPFSKLAFDTVFSMGVLYHRRSPMDHLIELREALNQGDGEVVLETLVIDGGQNDVLVPKGRYAKMRNVWFIPSCLMLERWLIRCGFKNVRLVDTNQTSVEEQRATSWMTFESLSDYLDPKDASKTVEGYPAPLRAVFTATL